MDGLGAFMVRFQGFSTSRVELGKRFREKHKEQPLGHSDSRRPWRRRRRVLASCRSSIIYCLDPVYCISGRRRRTTDLKRSELVKRLEIIQPDAWFECAKQTSETNQFKLRRPELLHSKLAHLACCAARFSRWRAHLAQLQTVTGDLLAMGRRGSGI